MAKTFTLKSNSYDGRYMELVCTQTPSDSKSNLSTIAWTLTTTGGSVQYYSTGPTKVVINGQTVYSQSRVAWDSYKFPAKKGSVSGTLTVEHDNNGEKSISVSFSTAIKEATVGTYTGTWTLDSIPRYATVTQSLKSKDEETIKINWSSDSVIDYLWYSINDGDDWVGLAVDDVKSGTYTISDCQAGAWHYIKTRVRRKDSQLKTDSTVLKVVTYEYPHCVSTPDFVIGKPVTLEFYNPLNRRITFKVIANGVTLTHSDWVTTSDTYTGLNAETTQAQLYATIPNQQACQYDVEVTYDGHTITTYEGNGYEVDPNVCSPIFSDFSYKDITCFDITGNDQILIEKCSGIRVTIPSANKMVAVKSATPKYYIATIDDQTVKANYTDNDVTFTFYSLDTEGIKRLNVRAYDSRGLSTLVYKDVTVIDYEYPVVNVDVKRLNNFEEQTTLKISGTYSKVTVDGKDKNTMTSVRYCYRETGGTWTEYEDVTFTASNGKYTCDDVILTLDRDKSYEFNVWVYDSIDENDRDATVDVGKPIFMVSSNKKTCYINGVELPTFESVYPIGSVYCSSTNTNPSKIYGGTWELIDKGFETDSTEIMQNATEYLSSFEVASIRTERTVRFRIHLTTAKDINDTSVTLGTVDLEAHGLEANNESYFLYGIFGDVAMSDGGNATITYDFNNTGVLEVNDCLNIDGTHVLPAGSSFYINAVVVTSQSRMNDDFCDKFYWKRTA